MTEDVVSDVKLLLDRLGLPEQLRTYVDSTSTILMRLQQIEKWIKKNELKLDRVDAKKVLAWVKQTRRRIKQEEVVRI